MRSSPWKLGCSCQLEISFPLFCMADEVGFVYCLTLLGMVVDLIREVLDEAWLTNSKHL